MAKLIIILTILNFAPAILAGPTAPPAGKSSNLTADFIKNLRDTFPALQKPPSLSNSGTSNTTVPFSTIAEIVSKAINNYKGGSSSSMPTLSSSNFLDTIIGFLTNGLLTGLKALLTPVAILLIIIINIVKQLLRVVLWLVEALLKTLLDGLGLGGLSKSLYQLLTQVQDLVNDLLNTVDDLLEQLSLIKEFNEKTNGLSRAKRDTAQFTLRQMWKAIKAFLKTGQFAASTAVSTATLPVTLPIKTAMLPVKAALVPVKAAGKSLVEQLKS
ncbi:uncharacterized protein LOC130672177 [Microplitis mediator]|uniref:uncharacterized protein LOC130672177 n=1 Tax=Microplitis mediator TaxID=375433 RepID=UPI002552F90A|nr:uncharacterized protein LOC130672177 [Microplitis mediator]